MLPLAHMGFTVTIMRAIEKKAKLPVMEYRLLLVASLLPDIVDKPLTSMLLDRSLYEGRGFGHSLAFLLLLGGLGLVYRLWRKDCIPATILFGVIFHDILDVMWLHAGILFWPLYGWTFPSAANEAWHGFITIGRRKILWLDVLDTLGALLLLHFFYKIASKDNLFHFLKTGKDPE